MAAQHDFATLDRHALRVGHGSLLDNPWTPIPPYAFGSQPSGPIITTPAVGVDCYGHVTPVVEVG